MNKSSGTNAWVPFLLADRSPNLRIMVIRQMLGPDYDLEEIRELELLREKDPISARLFALQEPDGSFRTQDGKRDSWRGIYSTSQALLRLGYLGYGMEHPAVKLAAEYLYSKQRSDGSWSLPEGKSERELGEAYTMIPFQTGLPLRGLAAAGYAEDPRSEIAYNWLLGNRLADGSWSSGVKGGQNVFPAGYRRLAHSRYGCRTNTTFAVCALAHHPTRRHSEAARRGLDLLLVQEAYQAHTLGFEVARTIGYERSAGFFTHFARLDAGLLLDLCWRIGARLEDGRVAQMVAFVRDLQGPYGLWEYTNIPAASRWVSFDLLRSLSRIEERTDWISREPRTPFQPYPKERKRY